MSLRSRLLLATLVLVALGLAAADAATYGSLRSSLLSRVDEQLAGARFFATRSLFDQDRGPGPGFGDRGGDSPPVAVAELIDPSGTIVASRTFGFTAQPAPRLPPSLPGSTADRSGLSSRLFSAGSTGGSDVRYRVLAIALGPGQGTVAIAAPLGDVDATLRRLILIEGLVSLLVLALVTALALWLVRVGLRPLTAMELAAEEIASGDLSRRVEPADDRTEVGRLGAALNAMLERIESAFAQRRATEARLRRFVADASHELRTPLTSIRGYAELFRHGADTRPEDLAKSMQRIEEESRRMGDLVDELLLLARLDQDPQLDRLPVDLAAIVRDAAADAKVVQPDRPINVDAPDELWVLGDEARLRQVAANLLSNALEHTPAGTAVRVRANADGEALLEVADEGEGLDAEQAARVFDRFFRVDEARSRERGGTGLGLSIVAAIARAHGGRVWLESSPGAGSTFSVALPLAAHDETPARVEPTAE